MNLTNLTEKLMLDEAAFFNSFSCSSEIGQRSEIGRGVASGSDVGVDVIVEN